MSYIERGFRGALLLGVIGGVSCDPDGVIPASGCGGWGGEGSANHSLVFDGVDDVLRLDHLDGTEGPALTLEAWVRLDQTSPPKPNILARRRPGGGADTFLFRVRADRGHVLEFGVGSGRGEWGVASRRAVPQGRWVHVAATHDRGVGWVSLYLNGEREVEVACPVPPGQGDLPLWLGGDPLHGPEARAFSGALDEIRIWSRVRSAEEIKATMKVHLRGDEPDLLLYWPLDEGRGQGVADLSGHAEQAVLGLQSGSDSADPRWSSDVPFP